MHTALNDTDRQAHFPCQGKPTRFLPYHPHILSDLLADASSFVRWPTVFVRLLFDNPQRVSSIPDDLEGSFKSRLYFTIQPLTHLDNTTTKETMVARKSSEDTPGKEPWGLRWRSSLAFITFGAQFLCTSSRV